MDIDDINALIVENINPAINVAAEVIGLQKTSTLSRIVLRDLASVRSQLVHCKCAAPSLDYIRSSMCRVVNVLANARELIQSCSAFPAINETALDVIGAAMADGFDVVKHIDKSHPEILGRSG